MIQTDNILAEKYLTAKKTVIESGFAWEIDWQEDARFEDVDESEFLRQAAWVILSSGMREATIRSKFSAVSSAFRNWESASSIVARAKTCRHKALSVFAHEAKIEAILTIAKAIADEGFDVIRGKIQAEGIDYLQGFPYLGPATSCHLSKNLGLNLVKPDRHLLRLSRVTGFRTPFELCRNIADTIGEKEAVVDVVLWRFATIRKDYLSHFSV